MIALALPLQCRIEVKPDEKSRILRLEIPQLDTTIEYDLEKLPPRQQGQQRGTAEAKPPDFALAALHEVIDDEGWHITTGAQCRSTTDIIMQAGCSSSSAFVVAWIKVSLYENTLVGNNLINIHAQTNDINVASCLPIIYRYLPNLPANP